MVACRAEPQPQSRGARARVVVTGATGLLGRQVMKELAEEKWDVLGFCFTRKLARCRECDLTDDEQTRRLLEDFGPDVVIHCAAERRPDVVQKKPEFAKKLNVDTTGMLAQLCNASGAWMLFLSTDYVFDGTSPPYTVDAKPNPLNVYGKHKCQAESMVLQFPRHAVLRVPLLYGPVEFLEESSVMELYSKLQSGLAKADNAQKRYPTSAGDIARVIRLMVEAVAAERLDMSGIFHWQSKECLTKYDMVLRIAEISRLDASGVAPDTVVPSAPRPQDSRLDCARLELALGARCPARTPFAEAMEEALIPFMVSDTFQHAFGKDSVGRKTISKADLVRVLQAVTPDLSDWCIEQVLESANMANQDTIAYEEFVRFIFQ